MDFVESIERATLAAISPSGVEEIDGWLLAFDAGTIHRAKSAVPLRHDSPNADGIDAIEARYEAHRLAAAFRVADDPRLASFQQELYRRGYRPERPTLVMVGATETVRNIAQEPPATVATSPDESWASAFVGEGFDRIDGVHRAAALARAAGSVFAAVREGDRAVAVGVAAFDFGWASVHGMRTGRAHRRRGLARRVLAGLADAALARGFQRMFLQVEAANSPARALYRRAGFENAWRYFYWQRASA